MIEYLGRVDQQVKVRGYRIELGEIESVLRQQAGVGEAVVTMREDAGGEKRLVAYVVGDESGVRPNAQELKVGLRSRLPEYMVPSAVMVLEKLPLLTSGKVDRKILPAPVTETTAVTGEARTVVEEILSGIWSDVLGVKKVGTQQNFFDLGGHSLLATRVMARMRKVFERELPLQWLFEHPTIAGMATVIEGVLREQERASIPPLVKRSRRVAEQLSFAQERLWFIEQLEHNSSTYNIPVAVRLRGKLDIGAMESAFREIVRRHEVLRTVFQEEEGRAVAVVGEEVEQRLGVVDLSGLKKEERERMAEQYAGEEARRVFDLGQGPLMRVKLLRLGEEEHVALLTMHHIVSDGWSVGVLVRELGVLYRAYAAGERSPLAELEVQYGDYAVWQREWLKGEVLERQIAYWKKQLEGAAVLELPTDHPRSDMVLYAGSMEQRLFGRQLTDSVRELARSLNVTLFSVLLAGWNAVLHSYTGKTDIVVGTLIANRTRQEVESLIGMFMNTLVMRTNLAGNPSFRELISRTGRVTLGAQMNQEVPFETLVREMQPQRDSATPPLFQTLFVHQNTP
ncbi:MAG TPA: condensation domain-containing protein, partial [Candidatus Sulfotelmatobacter sp.]|nr:condensation domain-containing protein [Candidatus Sulfotelmatobacter sp.]